MKKLLFSGSVAVMLLLSGCSTKEPAIDATHGQEEVSPVAGGTVDGAAGEGGMDIVAIDAEGMAAVDTNEMTMSGLEQQMETINFDFDKFNIRADMQDAMDSNVKLAKGDALSYMIKLEGNCDEWGSDEYNYALGLRRSNTVKQAMIADGVAESRITMVSYGESNPACSEKTEACWAKNRRVDFKLLP